MYQNWTISEIDPFEDFRSDFAAIFIRDNRLSLFRLWSKPSKFRSHRKFAVGRQLSRGLGLGGSSRSCRVVPMVTIPKLYPFVSLVLHPQVDYTSHYVYIYIHYIPLHAIKCQWIPKTLDVIYTYIYNPFLLILNVPPLIINMAGSF